MEKTMERPVRNVQRHRYVAPHRWAGEHSCLVGPFSSREVASQFEHYVLHRAGTRTSESAVRQLRDGWYIAVPQRIS